MYPGSAPNRVQLVPTSMWSFPSGAGLGNWKGTPSTGAVLSRASAPSPPAAPGNEARLTFLPWSVEPVRFPAIDSGSKRLATGDSGRLRTDTNSAFGDRVIVTVPDGSVSGPRGIS